MAKEGIASQTQNVVILHKTNNTTINVILSFDISEQPSEVDEK